MTDPIVDVGWSLIRAAVGLLVAGISIWGLKIVQITISDLRQNWGKWDTYPYPDKRAVRNLRILCTHVAGLLFGVGALILYLSWVFGWVAWHP